MRDAVLEACETHERKDEVLERIYSGRRFENDTVSLETMTIVNGLPSLDIGYRGFK
jgi:hypothetical protein